MKKKKKIKVIKRGSQKKPPKPPDIVVEELTKEESDSEMVSTVTDWIDEFKQKREKDRKEALKNF